MHLRCLLDSLGHKLIIVRVYVIFCLLIGTYRRREFHRRRVRRAFTYESTEIGTTSIIESPQVVHARSINVVQSFISYIARPTLIRRCYICQVQRSLH